MATIPVPGTLLVRDEDLPDLPPYRPFPDRPSGVWVKAFRDHIKETARPETFPGLYSGKIDRAANFRIIQKFEVDRKKRPDGDLIPCPRCRSPHKFLEGALAWFYDLQFCAAIGHCCGSHEAISEAEKEFAWREKRDKEELYLLEGLPLLAQKLIALNQLRSPAGEGLKLYRKFRKEAAPVHDHLRHVKAQHGGRLWLVEILRSAEDEEDDYTGPAGFRGRGRSQTETRDIEFGYIAGQTAVLKDYNPIKDIEETIRVLNSFDGTPSPDEALELIIKMSLAERRAAVAIVDGVDRGYAKITTKLSDFWKFFTQPNIENLHRYGTHRENALPFEAHYQSKRGRTLVVIKHKRVECRLLFEDKYANFAVDWPV